MFQLIRYIKPYMKEAVTGPLFKFFEACMEIFVPLIMSLIIDVGIKNSDYTYILKMGGLLVLIAVLGWGFAITAQFFCAKAALGFGMEVRKALFSHVLNMKQETVDKIGIPSLITRVTNDVTRAQTGVNMILRLALRAPFIVLGAIIMSGVINTKVMIIYILLVPVVVLFAFSVMKRTVPMYDRIQFIIDKIALFCRENLIGIRSVRAFGMQKKESEEFADKTDELYKLQCRAGRLSALLNPANTIIINAAIIFVLWLGGGLVNDGVLESGKIIALVNYLTQILVAIVATVDLTVTISRGNASAKRIALVLKEGEGGNFAENEDAFVNVPEIETIEFKNVDFAYERAGRPALKNISFKVKKGDSVGIIGGTGCGKSTVIRLLQGLYPVTEGEILINGSNINNLTEGEKKAFFSVVPQQARLFKGTVRENMRWGNPFATDDEIIGCLKNAAAWEFIKEKEGQLDFMIEQSGRNLSGGQKQRLTIARALIKKSPILILDDSTSALDFVTEAGIRKYLAGDALLGTTKFIVSQRTSGVGSCNVIIVLDEGEICGMGTHNELLKNCDVYREIYLSQHGDASEVAKL